MSRAGHRLKIEREAQIIDFDERFLEACPQTERVDLLAEARLLAQAFAPGGRLGELDRIAFGLSQGEHDAEMERSHARKLAAALRRLARAPSA